MAAELQVGDGPEAATLSLVDSLNALFLDVNRSDAPGLVVGIAHHDAILYRRGFGLASVELGVANTPRTRMRIGSTSKHITSLAVMLLVEEGKIDIDVGVRTYLPELASLEHEPTLRQFMNHTSGYRCYLDIGFLADGNTIRPKGAALAAQIRQRGSNFAPGEQMIYCNGGYHLLSVIVDRLSGMPFEEFVKTRVFEPMKMMDTEYLPNDFEIRPGMATLHIPLPGGGYRRGIFPSEEIRGEGAIISTVDDMLRWTAHVRGPERTIGSIETWRQILANTTLNNGLVNPYGLGLMRHPYRGVEIVHHAGGVTGGSCQMLTVPQHELDIVIITNGAPASPVEIAKKIVDLILADALSDPPVRPAADRCRPMVGRRYFSSTLGSVLGFGESDGKLTLSIFNSQGLPLEERAGELKLNFEDVAIGPFVVSAKDLASEGEPPATLTISESGNADAFALLPASCSLAEVAQPLIGTYRADDLDAAALITLTGDVLQLEIFGTFGINRATLEAFSPDAFGFKVQDELLPLTGILTVRRTQEEVVGFDLATPRSRHVFFHTTAGPTDPS